MRALALALILALSAVQVLAAAPQEVAADLQQVCVTIRSGDSIQGSGVVVTRPVDGQSANFVLTAYHVVQNLREVKDVITADGQSRKQVVYRDAAVTRELRQGTRTVGRTFVDVEVLNGDPERDLALLRLRALGVFAKGIEFYLDEKAPGPGSVVFHCASPGGEQNAASVTGGQVCQLGRIFEREGFGKGEYDQCDAAALPGSSGGMICLRDDGRLIGILSLGMRNTDSFHYFVPVRALRKWSEAIHAPWLVDAKQKPPTEADIKKIPLELNPPGFGPQPPTPKPAILVLPKLEPERPTVRQIVPE